MAKVQLGCRFLLGLIFFVFGLNGFLHFFPMPPMSEPAMRLMGAFMESGYLLPFIKATEVVCGAALLSGFYIPLALVVITPIVLNIFAFHLFLEHSGLPMAIIIIAMHCFLVYRNKASYSALLRKK